TPSANGLALPPVGRSVPDPEPAPQPPPTMARRIQDPLWVRVSLTVFALLVLIVLIVIPVVHVFSQALADGVGPYFRALFGESATLHAIGLTLMVAPTAVVLNLIFGVAAAWAIARFRFPGRSLLLALIDLPFSVSPVVAGLVFVLLF